MNKIIARPALLFFFVAAGLMAAKPTGDPVQVKYRSQSASVQIAGNSSLHDWTEKSEKGTSEATFSMNNDKITGLSGLTFTIAVKSLKSGHSAMDKNTYKALDADKHPNISYTMSTAAVNPVDAHTYSIRTAGKLTIAGNTREIDVTATGKVNADKSITVTGSKKFKMTDFDVKPPTAMFGTIKTGNDVTISYNLKFIK